ncbi:MAG: hypothetical protein AVDCRST_MAG01-01-1703, partial [uncultured Rubrobacteraceae bacterium]
DPLRGGRRGADPRPLPGERLVHLPGALRLRVLHVARAVVGRVVPGGEAQPGDAPPPGGRGPDKAASGL